MGVKCVLRWVNGDATKPDHPRAVLSILKKALEGLDGRVVSKWKIQCANLRPKDGENSGPGAANAAAAAAGAKEMYLVSFSEKPERQYLVLRQERMVMEADRDIGKLLDKLGLYKTKYTLEFDGNSYTLGDFSVKLGPVRTQGEEFKGLMVEVEYRPLGSLSIGQPLLQEFVTILQQAIAMHQTEAYAKGIKEEKCTGQLERVVPPMAEYSLPGRFSFCHTSVQYIALCTTLMAHGSNRIAAPSTPGAAATK